VKKPIEPKIAIANAICNIGVLFTFITSPLWL
jgi:hypothetical protein